MKLWKNITKKSSSQYYDLGPILGTGATYKVIYGERSNGKTYAVLKFAIEDYATNGNQLAILRRYDVDFVGKRGNTMFDALVANQVVHDATNGEYNNIFYYSSRWYFCKYENGEKVAVDETPFAYGFSLGSMEHDKGTSYPNVNNILFDEFITRTGYLTDEFVTLMNVVSTIVRQRSTVQIFMLGNTVNAYCPYFAEMGLKHIKKQQQGTIDLYQYGDSRLTVAVEYCGTNKNKPKENNFYFAFDNPKLTMITQGEWEIDIYPHKPTKHKFSDVLFEFFLIFDEDIVHFEVIQTDDSAPFLFAHKKTSELKHPHEDLIFHLVPNEKPNWRTNMIIPVDKVAKRIYRFFIEDMVFYDTNETGEIVKNYLDVCKKISA